MPPVYKILLKRVLYLIVITTIFHFLLLPKIDFIVHGLHSQIIEKYGQTIIGTITKIEDNRPYTQKITLTFTDHVYKGKSTYSCVFKNYANPVYLGDSMLIRYHHKYPKVPPFIYRNLDIDFKSGSIKILGLADFLFGLIPTFIACFLFLPLLYYALHKI